MKYYLVAVFDNESYKNLNPIQKNLSKRFRANRNSPTPYVLLDIVENPAIDKLEHVVEKIVNPYKLFKIKLTNEVYFSEANKNLNIKISDIGYIKRMNRLFSDTLKLHGFNVLDNDMESQMNLSIANINYVPKDIKKNDSEITYSFPFETLQVDRIEIWKFGNNKKEVVIKSYPLKKNLLV